MEGAFKEFCNCVSKRTDLVFDYARQSNLCEGQICNLKNPQNKNKKHTLEMNTYKKKHTKINWNINGHIGKKFYCIKKTMTVSYKNKKIISKTKSNFLVAQVPKVPCISMSNGIRWKEYLQLNLCQSKPSFYIRQCSGDDTAHDQDCSEEQTPGQDCSCSRQPTAMSHTCEPAPEALKGKYCVNNKEVQHENFSRDTKIYCQNETNNPDPPNRPGNYLIYNEEALEKHNRKNQSKANDYCDPDSCNNEKFSKVQRNQRKSPDHQQNTVKKNDNDPNKARGALPFPDRSNRVGNFLNYNDDALDSEDKGFDKKKHCNEECRCQYSKQKHEIELQKQQNYGYSCTCQIETSKPHANKNCTPDSCQNAIARLNHNDYDNNGYCNKAEIRNQATCMCQVKPPNYCRPDSCQNVSPELQFKEYCPPCHNRSNPCQSLSSAVPSTKLIDYCEDIGSRDQELEQTSNNGKLDAMPTCQDCDYYFSKSCHNHSIGQKEQNQNQICNNRNGNAKNLQNGRPEYNICQCFNQRKSQLNSGQNPNTSVPPTELKCNGSCNNRYAKSKSFSYCCKAATCEGQYQEKNQNNENENKNTIEPDLHLHNVGHRQQNQYNKPYKYCGSDRCPLHKQFQTCNNRNQNTELRSQPNKYSDFGSEHMQNHPCQCQYENPKRSEDHNQHKDNNERKRQQKNQNKQHIDESYTRGALPFPDRSNRPGNFLDYNGNHPEPNEYREKSNSNRFCNENCRGIYQEQAKRKEQSNKTVSQNVSDSYNCATHQQHGYNYCVHGRPQGQSPDQSLNKDKSHNRSKQKSQSNYYNNNEDNSRGGLPFPDRSNRPGNFLVYNDDSLGADVRRITEDSNGHCKDQNQSHYCLYDPCECDCHLQLKNSNDDQSLYVCVLASKDPANQNNQTLENSPNTCKNYVACECHKSSELSQSQFIDWCYCCGSKLSQENYKEYEINENSQHQWEQNFETCACSCENKPTTTVSSHDSGSQLTQSRYDKCESNEKSQNYSNQNFGQCECDEKTDLKDIQNFNDCDCLGISEDHQIQNTGICECGSQSNRSQHSTNCECDGGSEDNQLKADKYNENSYGCMCDRSSEDNLQKADKFDVGNSNSVTQNGGICGCECKDNRVKSDESIGKNSDACIYDGVGNKTNQIQNDGRQHNGTENCECDRSSHETLQEQEKYNTNKCPNGNQDCDDCYCDDTSNKTNQTQKGITNFENCECVGSSQQNHQEKYNAYKCPNGNQDFDDCYCDDTSNKTNLTQKGITNFENCECDGSSQQKHQKDEKGNKNNKRNGDTNSDTCICGVGSKTNPIQHGESFQCECETQPYSNEDNKQAADFKSLAANEFCSNTSSLNAQQNRSQSNNNEIPSNNMSGELADLQCNDFCRAQSSCSQQQKVKAICNLTPNQSVQKPSCNYSASSPTKAFPETITVQQQQIPSETGCEAAHLMCPLNEYPTNSQASKKGNLCDTCRRRSAKGIRQEISTDQYVENRNPHPNSCNFFNRPKNCICHLMHNIAPKPDTMTHQFITTPTRRDSQIRTKQAYNSSCFCRGVSVPSSKKTSQYVCRQPSRKPSWLCMCKYSKSRNFAQSHQQQRLQNKNNIVKGCKCISGLNGLPENYQNSIHLSRNKSKNRNSCKCMQSQRSNEYLKRDSDVNRERNVKGDYVCKASCTKRTIASHLIVDSMSNGFCKMKKILNKDKHFKKCEGYCTEEEAVDVLIHPEKSTKQADEESNSYLHSDPDDISERGSSQLSKLKTDAFCDINNYIGEDQFEKNGSQTPCNCNSLRENLKKKYEEIPHSTLTCINSNQFLKMHKKEQNRCCDCSSDNGKRDSTISDIKKGNLENNEIVKTSPRLSIRESSYCSSKIEEKELRISQMNNRKLVNNENGETSPRLYRSKSRDDKIKSGSSCYCSSNIERQDHLSKREFLTSIENNEIVKTSPRVSRRESREEKSRSGDQYNEPETCYCPSKIENQEVRTSQIKRRKLENNENIETSPRLSRRESRDDKSRSVDHYNEHESCYCSSNNEKQELRSSQETCGLNSKEDLNDIEEETNESDNEAATLQLRTDDFCDNNCECKRNKKTTKHANKISKNERSTKAKGSIESISYAEKNKNDKSCKCNGNEKKLAPETFNGNTKQTDEFNNLDDDELYNDETENEDESLLLTGKDFCDNKCSCKENNKQGNEQNKKEKVFADSSTKSCRKPKSNKKDGYEKIDRNLASDDDNISTNIENQLDEGFNLSQNKSQSQKDNTKDNSKTDDSCNKKCKDLRNVESNENKLSSKTSIIYGDEFDLTEENDFCGRKKCRRKRNSHNDRSVKNAQLTKNEEDLCKDCPMLSYDESESNKNGACEKKSKSKNENKSNKVSKNSLVKVCDNHKMQHCDDEWLNEKCEKKRQSAQESEKKSKHICKKRRAEDESKVDSKENLKQPQRANKRCGKESKNNKTYCTSTEELKPDEQNVQRIKNESQFSKGRTCKSTDHNRDVQDEKCDNVDILRNRSRLKTKRASCEENIKVYSCDCLEKPNTKSSKKSEQHSTDVSAKKSLHKLERRNRETDNCRCEEALIRQKNKAPCANRKTDDKTRYHNSIDSGNTNSKRRQKVPSTGEKSRRKADDDRCECSQRLQGRSHKSDRQKREIKEKKYYKHNFDNSGSSESDNKLKGSDFCSKKTSKTTEDDCKCQNNLNKTSSRKLNSSKRDDVSSKRRKRSKIAEELDKNDFINFETKKSHSPNSKTKYVKCKLHKADKSCSSYNAQFDKKYRLKKLSKNVSDEECDCRSTTVSRRNSKNQEVNGFDGYCSRQRAKSGGCYNFLWPSKSNIKFTPKLKHLKSQQISKQPIDNNRYKEENLCLHRSASFENQSHGEHFVPNFQDIEKTIKVHPVRKSNHSTERRRRKAGEENSVKTEHKSLKLYNESRNLNESLMQRNHNINKGVENNERICEKFTKEAIVLPKFPVKALINEKRH